MESTKVGAIIPAGGYGTFDKKFSKLGALLDGRPMIVHVIDKVLELKRVGTLSHVCVVLNSLYEKEVRAILEEHLAEEDYASLLFALQTERCGAAGAVELALPLFPKDVKDIFVTFGDMPLWRTETMTRLIQEHQKVSPDGEYALTMVTLKVPPGHGAWKYGRIFYRDGRIVAIVEPKDSRIPLSELAAGTDTVNPSLYVYNRAFLERNLRGLAYHESVDGFPEERNLPDLIKLAYKANRLVHQVPLLDAHEALGVNTEEELIEVQIVLYTRRNAEQTS